MGLLQHADWRGPNWILKMTLCYNNFRRSPPSSCAQKNLVASWLKKNLPCSRKAQCDGPKYPKSLTSLTRLEILNCPGTWALPESVGDLTSLKCLYITNCPEIRLCQRD
ncbi:hypothetical protein MRB53_034302 [Persea americana]|uniref:Uncharacterized protein n=1 Tax=Persea americana TaxID=3435 RepID=A0ACC2KY67_PERAE|nr:hypothetical protein MRB53_034302 [Persea americana]